MNLTIFGPAYYTDTERLKFFNQSAIHHRVKVHLYGFGKPFGTWIQTHIEDCLYELKWMTSDVAMFTDTSDVLWLTDATEIEDKYIAMGRPPLLIGAEHSGANGGGWIGERLEAIRILEILAKDDSSGDPQVRWRKAIEDGLVHVELDQRSWIFQIMGEDTLEIKSGRMRNTVTGSWPCLLHCAGGSSHSIFGKNERIEPLWEALLHDSGGIQNVTEGNRNSGKGGQITGRQSNDNLAT